jgi:alanyl-tRNA synthetase
MGRGVSLRIQGWTSDTLSDQKEALKAKFSADYKHYYLVELFEREGFLRKKCENCGRFFWTLDEQRKRCDDPPCSPYSFIGNPPTKNRLDLIQTWKVIEDFFVRHGHASVKRYPVVSRWRPDLYFTVASIIDFQRIEGGKVVFQLPVNPLVVPQPCLRFNDIPSVGLSGKHFTTFTMVGQTAIDNKEGYWKDRTIDLDFELLTKDIGIAPKEITFNEDVWVGYGAFGYSLEYYVRGLELGNAVFTAFEGDVSSYRDLPERVVDMGAGLQRWTWVTQGTPTAYDANFTSVLAKMNERCNVQIDKDLFLEFSKLAGAMNADEAGSLSEPRRRIAKQLGVSPEYLEKHLAPQEALYAIADHAQTLLFAVADGMLPSNSGGGYNLRILFRRAMDFIRYNKFPLTILDVVNWHIDYLRAMYPELAEHREDVAKVLGVELSRFESSSGRIAKTVNSIAASGRSVSTEELIRLYDSDGVTPEELIEAGAKVDLPENFYGKVQARHFAKKEEEEGEEYAEPKDRRRKFDVGGLPPTELLYYEDEERFEFEAKVLEVFDRKFVVLNRTFFYPRGGGQEPDRGTIAGSKVVDVVKYGDVVLHQIEGTAAAKGADVECKVESRRRQRIMRIHTATHIINGSARQVLGPWVWQHSAFKEEDYGRLDITHFAHLTTAEIGEIEDLANEIVRRDLPVDATFMSRKEAEEKFGVRLYQGGVIPTKLVRVVNMGGWDVEACGGTHTKTTGQVGFIKITKVERIQDGVERIEFVAGEPGVEYVHKMDSSLEELSSLLGTQRENLPRVAGSLMKELEESRSREKGLAQALVENSIPQVVSSAKVIGPLRLYVAKRPQFGEDLVISQGERSVAAEPSLIYVGLLSSGKSARVICFVGPGARKLGYSASDVVKKLAPILGGSGGGSQSFAQGGGPLVEKIDEAADALGRILPTG